MLTKNQIKLIRSLSSKKNRQKHGLFIVEGEKLVDEVLNSNWEIDAIYATNEWKGENANIISKNELGRISFQKSPNKVLAIVKIKSNDCKISGDTVLALDGINDPGNLGTIIRLADWFGIEHILCSIDCVDYLNPKVVQSSMGSFSRVSLHYTDLVDAFEKNNTYSLFLTTLDGGAVEKLKNTDNKRIIVFGSEANGIRENILKLNAEKITIPKSKGSKAESLNVANVSAIVLSWF